MAIAYFLTFTTYGTWLPGRKEGSVDREQNEYGMPFIEGNASREEWIRGKLKQPAFVMGEQEREIACRAVVELSFERGWDLLVVHVRSNHIHLVVRGEVDAERMMSDMKGRASRELTRAGFDSASRRRWTRHGSTRRLLHEEDVTTAIRYILDEQGERFAWYAKEGNE